MTVPRGDGPLRAWERLFRRGAGADFGRVRTCAQVSSTQDEARRLLGVVQGKPFAVLAARQTAGRGCMGRRWTDSGGSGLTFSVGLPRTAATSAAVVSLAAGVAVLEAVAAARDGGEQRGRVENITTQVVTGKAHREAQGEAQCLLPRLLLKWPNDIVHGEKGGPGDVRKLAGVLIEAVGDWLLVGVGVNVYQSRGAWRGAGLNAVSLAEIGIRCSRPRLAGMIAGRLLGLCERAPAAVVSAWKRHDALIGRSGHFSSKGMEVRGIVRGIEPLESLTIEEEESGEWRVLDAATTTRVH